MEENRQEETQEPRAGGGPLLPDSFTHYQLPSSAAFLRHLQKTPKQNSTTLSKEIQIEATQAQTLLLGLHQGGTRKT